MTLTLDQVVETALDLVQGGLNRLPPEERVPYLWRVSETLRSMAVRLETADKKAEE